MSPGTGVIVAVTGVGVLITVPEGGVTLVIEGGWLPEGAGGCGASQDTVIKFEIVNRPLIFAVA